MQRLLSGIARVIPKDIKGYAMENRLIYYPVGIIIMMVFAFLIIAVVSFLFLDLAKTAFTKIGFMQQELWALYWVQISSTWERSEIWGLR